MYSQRSTGLAGASLAIMLAAGATAARADMMTISDTADTMVRQVAPITNWGAAAQLTPGSLGTNSPMHVLLRFDLSSIPAGATINSVTLTTTSDGSDAGSSSSYSLNVYALVSADNDWIEGTGEGAQNSSNSAAWNAAVSTGNTVITPWVGGSNGGSVAGTDYIDTVLASYAGNPRTITAGTTMGFVSTADFAGAVSADLGAGEIDLLLANDDPSRNLFRIKTREQAGFAPSLAITYAVPEPASLLLMGMAGLGLLARRPRA